MLAHPPADSFYMTVLADDAWVVAARARAQRGNWERDSDTIFKELRKQAEVIQASLPALPACPFCASHPPMMKFPRHELLTMDPFLYCGTCYGFWAVGDAISRGVADRGFDHPALRAIPAPRRCKECMGHLKPDNVCAKCGKEPAVLGCPNCSQPMQRFIEKGIHLDQCAPCRGTWFDTGEISAVYDLESPQSLAMATVDENAADNVAPPWLLAAQVLGRVFLPFLPL
jgi:Zn-finger nucleic acid-binding protein